MAALGVLFILVVLGETLARGDRPLADILFWSGWVLWVTFLAEFVLRLAVAPATGRFLRRNWWQLLFLAVPFLRFLRLFRVGRAGRIVSSAVRGGRSAGRTLTGRLGWLLVIHLMIVLAASQLLFEFGPYRSFAAALHAAALASVSGEPLRQPGALAALMDVALAVYAVVVFAATAGTIGAYLLERRSEEGRALSRVGDPGRVAPGGRSTAPTEAQPERRGASA
jgi:voltage-gated potassium channel